MVRWSPLHLFSVIFFTRAAHLCVPEAYALWPEHSVDVLVSLASAPYKKGGRTLTPASAAAAADGRPAVAYDDVLVSEEDLEEMASDFRSVNVVGPRNGVQTAAGTRAP